LAPASNPSAMIEGRPDALSLTVEATFLTRPLMPLSDWMELAAESPLDAEKLSAPEF
jgi:hypothetical protein